MPSPLTKRVPPVGHPDREHLLAEANTFLRQCQLWRSTRHTTTFAGYLTTSTSDEPVPYMSRPFDPLWDMARYLNPQRVDDMAIDLSWDEPVLTATFTWDDATATFELTRMTNGQRQLALALRRRDVRGAEPALLALEFPDVVAELTAMISPRKGESLEREPEDPEGLLEVAEALTRAGVATFDETALSVLRSLAEGWTGDAPELLTALDAVLAER